MVRQLNVDCFCTRCLLINEQCSLSTHFAVSTDFLVQFFGKLYKLISWSDLLKPTTCGRSWLNHGFRWAKSNLSVPLRSTKSCFESTAGWASNQSGASSNDVGAWVTQDSWIQLLEQRVAAGNWLINDSRLQIATLNRPRTVRAALQHNPAQAYSFESEFIIAGSRHRNHAEAKGKVYLSSINYVCSKLKVKILRLRSLRKSDF